MKLKLVNVTIGKLGQCFVGPKQYLNNNIALGEAAICIARDDAKPSRPFIWVMGPIDLLIDYISVARHSGELAENDATLILARLDEAKKNKPKTSLARLASVLDLDENELSELIQLAQVHISNPIMGTRDVTSGTSKTIFAPKTVPTMAKTTQPN